MRFAYADPPYPGHTKRGLYKSDPRCAEVDHANLVAELEIGFPDGWALSTGSTNLRAVLPLCPEGTRVMACVRDYVSANALIKKGCAGAKPEAVCRWLFAVLGAQPGDELVDLFPGSGAVTAAWRAMFGVAESEGAAARAKGGDRG